MSRDMLKVGQHVVVAEPLLRRRLPGWDAAGDWHLGRVTDFDERSARPWLVAIIGHGTNLSLGVDEIAAGQLQLCVSGAAAIRAAQKAMAAEPRSTEADGGNPTPLNTETGYRELFVEVGAHAPAAFTGMIELGAAFEAFRKVLPFVLPRNQRAVDMLTAAVRVVLGVDPPSIVERPGISELRIAIATMPPTLEYDAPAPLRRLIHAAQVVIGR